MLLCPDCYTFLSHDEASCQACPWEFTKTNGIAQLVSTKDKKSPLFSSYLNNYETIATDDMTTAFIEDQYIALQAKKIASLLPSLKNKDFCDIGSGRGFLLNQIKLQKPRSITAVDISLSYLKNLEPDITRYQANAENLPFKEKFDVITCTDIMEHVINIGGFLHSVKQALKPNGQIIIRVPYQENLMNYAIQNGCKYEFAHLRDFDKHNLKRLFHFSGLKINQLLLDSFSLQIPQNYWLKTQRRMNQFMKFQRYMQKKLSNDSNINLYNPRLLRFFLRPLEITVVAEKN